jgi:hypothetical protein
MFYRITGGSRADLRLVLPPSLLSAEQRAYVHLDEKSPNRRSPSERITRYWEVTRTGVHVRVADYSDGTNPTLGVPLLFRAGIQLSC